MALFLVAWAASSLALTPGPLAAGRRRPAARRWSSNPLSMDELEAMEAELLSGAARRPPPLGRECALYRWTQDKETLRVEVPLPFLPPKGDVSLVVGINDFALAVVNSGLEVRGDLGGAVVAPRSRWTLETAEDGAPSLALTVVKAGGGATDVESAGDVFWGCFLRGESAAPTARYRGVCDVTGAAFVQTKDAVDLSVPCPDGASARDVSVDVAAESWSVSVAGAAVGGELFGPVKASATAWLIDDGRVHVALEKRTRDWWPGLTRPR